MRKYILKPPGVAEHVSSRNVYTSINIHRKPYTYHLFYVSVTAPLCSFLHPRPNPTSRKAYKPPNRPSPLPLPKKQPTTMIISPPGCALLDMIKVNLPIFFGIISLVLGISLYIR